MWGYINGKEINDDRCVFYVKKILRGSGNVSLKEKDNTIQVDIWNTYKIFPITENIVLFKHKDNEFVVTNGYYRQEMG